jgi:hypothetical protein
MTGDWGLKHGETGKVEHNTVQYKGMQRSLPPFGAVLGSTEYMIKK